MRSINSTLNYVIILSSLIIAPLLITNSCIRNEESVQSITPPAPEKIPKELTIHEHTRIDNYYWLNDRENPEVINYLKAENAYRDAVLKPTEKLQKKLYNEIINRIKQEDKSVPYFDNGYFYYWRFEKGEEYRIYARKKETLDTDEEIILDVSKMAEGSAFFDVTGLSVSENNNYLAYGVDTVSRRKYTIHFKDLRTGKLLTDKLQNTSGHAVWANDNMTVFYTTKDSTLRSYKVMKHIIGTNPSEDIEIYHEKDDTYSVYVSKTKSDKYVVVASYHTLSTEMKLIDADRPHESYDVFQEREKKHEYRIFHHISKFYVLTNWKAKNFRLMESEVGKTEKQYWKEVIPHRKDVLLENVTVFKDYLVLGERKGGIRQIRIINMNNQSEHYINFEEESYVAYPMYNTVFDTKKFRYRYTSLTTPPSTFDYDMTSKEKILLKMEEIGGKFDPEDYQSERLWATVRDSTRVPISLVYSKGLVKDGNNPLLISGYGSYGSSVDPYFSISRLSLLNRGFVFAMFHIRGGSEMGRHWYEDGKLLKKKNTFTDFIDCAEFLINQGYTNPDKLFAQGGSAGGLLMGTVVNMRPDLFKGIIANVPWVDIVTTMLDDSIPLTTSEFDEWGNPKQKEYYDYMLSYSPYDNVDVKDYPAMYVTTGLHDSQVQYFEPAKWVAKLRDMKTDTNIIILDVNMESGHGGASGRFKSYERTAKEYSFMLILLNISK